MCPDSDPQDHERALESTEALPLLVREGQSVGSYRMLSQIGEGGMGEVWLAQQESPVRRRVAMKFIKVGMDTRRVLARFESERQALALMDHPNIAKVFDAGTTDTGRPYFVMEYVKGMALTRYCDQHRLETNDRLELMIQICEGVQHAHQKGVLHRDLKPNNVLVELHGDRAFPKIIDFGVAKATAQTLTDKTLYTRIGELIGTPSYMSPEQASIDELDVDTRTDVYSLGVMLYHLLVGVTPIDTSELRDVTFVELQRQIREVDPPRPSTRVASMGDEAVARASRRGTDPRSLARLLRGELDWIVMKALEKDRTRRYGSASELAQDLRRYLRHEPVHAGPPHVSYRMRKFVRRHRVGVGVVAGLFVITAGFAAAMAVQAERIARERDRANREAAAATQVADFLVGMFEVSDPDEARGTSVTARELLDRGSDRIERELVEQPALQARMMQTMGRVYTALGLFASAEPLLTEAVTLRQQAAEADASATAGVLVDLGNLRILLGEYDRADSLFARALALRRSAVSPSAADVGSVLRRQAEIRRHQTRYDEGESLYLRALEALRTESDSRGAEIAQTLSDLGVLYSVQGKREEARSVLQESFEIRERILPPDHPDLGEALNNLAALNWQLGDLEGAESLYDRAIAVRRRALGPDHPDVAQTLHNMGTLYMTQGKNEQALATVEQALDIHRAAFGAEHPLVAHSIHTLGVIARRAGDLDTAFAHIREGLRMREAVLGPDHEKVGLSLLSLGICHADRSEWPQAEAAAQRSFTILDAALGPDHRFSQQASELLDRARGELGHETTEGGSGE